MTWAAEQSAAFDDLADAFGATATWFPSLGGDPVVQQPVLFESPTKGIGIDAPGGEGLNTRFDFTDFVLSAQASHFPGLKAAVEAGHVEEMTIEENGQEVGRYNVRGVRYVGDGHLIEARLSEVTLNAQPDRGQPDPAIASLFAG
ncbi:hypothetical protein NH8B_0554 [Pseudogulbenkiania sp. NH8B]|uniref:hypothetical protein n=1 Tax=Pseudogulbenkiania sp. (strain NH8B) TaxID=748280 RepID=UPI00022794FD|nr:hypothetical protein [Pseudogulbenkiania sp. NH8B]BAK75389.1 hypothetical protein NH8B_0554 [Pseudogulbenkiania sp. NH8B]